MYKRLRQYCDRYTLTPHNTVYDSVNLTFELIADEQRKDATLDKLNDTSL